MTVTEHFLFDSRFDYFQKNVLSAYDPHSERTDKNATFFDLQNINTTIIFK